MKLKNKLSFSLGIRSLVLLICLGLAMACLQTLFDFKARQGEVRRIIDSVVSSAKGSASNAVYLLDNDIAEQVIEGLAYFDYFSYAAVIDDKGEVMAEFSRLNKSITESSSDDNEAFIPILSLITEQYSTRVIDLIKYDEFNANQELSRGQMILRINNHVALAGVYDRAMRAFVISIFAYVLLTLALGVMYHFSLAAPLTKLSRRFQRVNTKSIATQKISHLMGHEKNEFSMIVNSANDMLERISSGQVLLTERSQRFRLILDTAPALIYALDGDLNFVFANKSTATFYGYSIYELKGNSASEVVQPIDPDLMQVITKFIHSNKRQFIQVLPVINAGNITCHMEMSFVKFKTPDGHNILVTASDITKRVQAEEKIESLAYYDPLTSLPNRNKAYEVLNRTTDDEGLIYGIAAIADLDQFKRINDTLSHSVGDQLIVKLAKRLRKEFSFSDLTARLGADEFLCIEESVSKDLAVAQNSAAVLGERLRSCINKEIEIGLHSYALSASVGVVVFKKSLYDADEILQYADTAMYESKKAGRNCVTLFKDEMATQAAELLKLERNIMKAMFKDEFFFVLQPLIDASNNAMVSAEALIRWRKDGEVISPAEFIPFLEESALIVDVGERILNKVCALIAELEDSLSLDDDFKIAVNISGKQLARVDFIEQVSKILDANQVEGRRLEFEITESVALNNMQDTINKMNELRKMGIRFSLDDFGTGYSSLSHLKDLPVDKLKIDRSFINDLCIDRQGENLVRSIIQLASNLSLRTVAEGVETKDQVEWLNENGKVLIQGFYFSKPLETKEFISSYLKT